MLSGSSLLVLGDFDSSDFLLIAEFVKEREFRDPFLKLRKTLFYKEPCDLENEGEIFRYHNIIVSLPVFGKLKDKLEKVAKTKNVIVLSRSISPPMSKPGNGTRIKFMQLDHDLRALVNPVFYTYCHPLPH